MTAEQVRLHTIAPGEPGAPLVVFAHGLEDAWGSWLPLARELDPSLRLVALDLPWRPGSDYGWRDRSAGLWLAQGLDLLDAAPDVLVAHSFGANAALELLCRRDPRAGRAAALICPLYRQPRHPVTWRMFDRARDTFVNHIRDGLRSRLNGRAETLDPEVLTSMVDFAIDRVGPFGFLTAFHQFAASADLPLHAVDLPITVLAGGADPTLSREAATMLAAGIPGARLLIHDDYDHFGHVRHADGVAARIAELVDAVCLSTSPTGEFG